MQVDSHLAWSERWRPQHSEMNPWGRALLASPSAAEKTGFARPVSDGRGGFLPTAPQSDDGPISEVTEKELRADPWIPLLARRWQNCCDCPVTGAQTRLGGALAFCSQDRRTTDRCQGFSPCASSSAGTCRSA